MISSTVSSDFNTVLSKVTYCHRDFAIQQSPVWILEHPWARGRPMRTILWILNLHRLYRVYCFLDPTVKCKAWTCYWSASSEKLILTKLGLISSQRRHRVIECWTVSEYRTSRKLTSETLGNFKGIFLADRRLWCSVDFMHESLRSNELHRTGLRSNDGSLGSCSECAPWVAHCSDIMIHSEHECIPWNLSDQTSGCKTFRVGGQTEHWQLSSMISSPVVWWSPARPVTEVPDFASWRSKVFECTA